MNDLSSQISAMLNFSASSGGNDDEPEQVSEPGEQPTQAGEPAGSEGAEEEVEAKTETSPPGDENEPLQGKAPSQDEPPDNGETSELDELKSENEYLRSKIQEVLSQPVQGASQETEAPSLSIGDFDPIGDNNIEDIIETPESFKSWAKSAFQGFGQQLVSSLKEQLPQMVKSHASETASQQQKANEFYRQHSDLEPYKPYVAFKMQQIASTEENQSKSMDEILSLTAQAVRDDLKIRGTAPSESGKPSNSQVGLPKKGARSSSRSRKAEPELSGTEKEIQDMLAVLD